MDNRRQGAETAYIERFNARLRDEMLNGEIFYILRETQIVIESWRRHDNAVRPHASLGHKPPAPEVFVPAFAAWPTLPAEAAELGSTANLELTLNPDHPMGADQPRTSPRATSKSTSSSARCAKELLVTPRALIAGGAAKSTAPMSVQLLTCSQRPDLAEARTASVTKFGFRASRNVGAAGVVAPPARRGNRPPGAQMNVRSRSGGREPTNGT